MQLPRSLSGQFFHFNYYVERGFQNTVNTDLSIIKRGIAVQQKILLQELLNEIPCAGKKYDQV